MKNRIKRMNAEDWFAVCLGSAFVVLIWALVISLIWSLIVGS